MTDVSLPARTITPRGSLLRRARDIVSYRELLVNLVRKELKVKYKSSILGFLWSLLNPAMLLVVYYFVFSVVLGSGIPRFPIYLLSGLLVWNVFNVGLLTATGSIVGNAGIVNKVWFPREVLPLGAIGAALVHFFLQSLVLVGALLVFRHPVDWRYLPLLPVALGGLLLVLAGLSFLLAAINVYLRDVQHLVELILLAWFFASPIVYSYDLIAGKLGGAAALYLINPVTGVVMVFQRAIYGSLTDVVHNFPMWWYLRNLAYVYVLGVIILLIGMTVFRRLEGNFTEEL
ncbi:MAG TPA: ABC transporter permease [Acidimicrobiales bacterium]|jgi:ABC-2 type transport system permease protein|nr:ABC transporter permease [Acidimicrobiales bacterium]